ncbi:MAG: hypothetical protein HF976_08090 [ANME-2 cluster archaeon]|nr:hypothetical protein [ANME-2 cluster archaeon]MBC2701355.1 hypothetical protein [ANME-2 cluster archaeon]MBC2708437.1 hypothetical protein [ANME-2 cluster archaeon]MBC2745668.1 hypothetical protein [ANME-2 cluster archaeon]
MRKRKYHHFPLHNVDFTQKYSFWANLPYLVETFAGMNKKSGSFKLMGNKGETLKTKRNIAIDIADANVDFVPLTNQNQKNILLNIDKNGTIDFRFRILYSYLNTKYSRIATRGDTFLIRSELADGILTLKIHLADGPGHTTCNEIADTIVDEIDRSNKK